MNNYNYLYESAMQDNFERQILSGFLTEAKVKELIENNQLNEQQMKVVEELFPALSGLKNVAKGAMSGLKGAYQKGKDLYQTGRDDAKKKAEDENVKRAKVAKWNEIDKIVNNSQLLQKMQAFSQLFPNDAFIKDVSAYFAKALGELQEYLARYHSDLEIKGTGQQFQSELDQQAQQKSINAQADAANERSNLRSAGITGKPQQNTRRSKVGQPLKVRQRAMTSDSWDRLGNIE